MDQKPQNTGITGEDLFRLGPKKPEGALKPGELNIKLSDEIGSLSRRIRMLEDRYGNIRKQAIVTDQNMMEDSKNIQTQLNILVDDVNAVRKQVKDVFEKLSMFSAELEHTAKRSELNTMNRYLDMWEPLNFVTRKQAEQMIQEAIEEYKKNKQV